MNNNNPNAAADAPVPPPGTEQAAEQANKPQQPPVESSTLDTVSSVVDGVADATDVIGGILSIFDV